MRKILLEVIDFVKNPSEHPFDYWNFKTWLRYFFNLLLLELLSLTIILPIILLIDSFEPLITELRTNYHENSFSYLIIIAVILAPIIEEFLFRYPLRYRSFTRFFINQGFWQKYYRYFFYFSLILFGLIHASNYNNQSLLFYVLSPLIVISQLIGSVIMSFLRLKFNLTTSIVYHMVWNAIAILIPIVMWSFEKPYTKNEDGQRIFIHTIPYSDIDKQVFTIDSIGNHIHSLNIQYYSINHILDSIAGYTRNENDYLIELKISSEKGLSVSQVKEMLLEYDREQSKLF